MKRAAEEYLRYIEHDRERKPSTVKGYRWLIKAQILPPLGELFIEDVTPELVEAWLASLKGRASSRRKTVVLLYGIFRRARKVYRLPSNPVADVEKPTQSSGGEIEVLSPEEVWALVRAADVRAGRRDLPDGCVHGAADGRAARAALARRRLRGLRPAGPRELLPAARSRARSRARSARFRSPPRSPRPSLGWASAGLDRRGRSGVRRRAGCSSTAPRCDGATRPRSGGRDCGRCASTTCGTRSGPA